MNFLRASFFLDLLSGPFALRCFGGETGGHELLLLIASQALGAGFGVAILHFLLLRGEIAGESEAGCEQQDRGDRENPWHRQFLSLGRDLTSCFNPLHCNAFVFAWARFQGKRGLAVLGWQKPVPGMLMSMEQAEEG